MVRKLILLALLSCGAFAQGPPTFSGGGGKLSAIAGNTTLANVTSGSASPTAAAIPSGIQNYVAGTGYNQANIHQVMVSGLCADSSGSGTAQSCTMTPTFTPTTDDCITYTTTTTNSGAGLTIAVSSLGAKSVAIPGASGWTTTLTGSIIPANTPLLACYSGTNWNVQQTGTAASGGSSAFPLTVSGTVTSGGIPYFNSTTQESSSALLAANGVVLGGGAGVAPSTVSGIVTDGTSVLTLGVAGTSVGGVAFKNATSGTITLNPATGALGTVTATLPANTGTVAETNLAETFSALQTFGSNASIAATAHGPLLSENTSAVVAAGAGTTNMLFASGGASADGAYKSWADLDSTQYAAATGTAQAQVVTLAPPATSLVAGLEINFLPVANNSAAAPTLAVNGLTAKAITKLGTTALVANDLTTTAVASVIYDGTEFQLQNPQTATSTSSGYLGAVTAIGSAGSTQAFTCATSLPGVQTMTLSANLTISFTQSSGNACKLTLKITQAAGGNDTVTWTSVKWPGGVVPVMTAAASAVDVYSCLLDGTTTECTAGQSFQ